MVADIRSVAPVIKDRSECFEDLPSRTAMMLEADSVASPAEIVTYLEAHVRTTCQLTSADHRLPGEARAVAELNIGATHVLLVA